MDVNFFVICIGNVLKSRMARDSVLLLGKFGYRVNFPERQGCYDQPVIDSGYIKEMIPGMKNLIAALGDNDDPVTSPAGSCTYVVKGYPTYLMDEPEWTSRAEKVAVHMQDLTSSIINTLEAVDASASLQGRAVYHPSCNLVRKLGVKDEPLTLPKNVRGLKPLIFAEQSTCYGFGGTFSVKMAEISGEMVEEEVVHLMEVRPEYLVGADVSCPPNINGRLQQEGQKVKAMHIAEVLMSC